MFSKNAVFILIAAVFVCAVTATGYQVTDLSDKSAACIECHKKESRSIYQQWGESKHHSANIGCYECHKADRSEKGSFRHDTKDADGKITKGEYIKIIVSPKDCARCHEKEVKEFASSHHSKGGSPSLASETSGRTDIAGLLFQLMRRPIS